jgi:hypothetical protein
MTNNKNENLWIIWLLPFLFLVWSLLRLHLSGPFYLTRIDPEYPYLLNGLNCAILKFDHIGHVDHPGTPFQILTGIFIWITYLFAGQGNIANDVISRPELYLTAGATLLSFMSAGSIIWLGHVAIRNYRKIWAAIFLQSVFFLNPIMIDINSRYIPDRLLPVITVLVIGLTLKFFYEDNFKGWKYAIYSGLLLGIGFVTKFSFIPVLLLPLILIKSFREKAIYVAALIFSIFFSFLPASRQINHFKNFIINISTHDGLYGKGAEVMFDWPLLLHNINEIFRVNLPFTILFVLALLSIVYLFVKPDLRSNFTQEHRFLLAFVIISVFGIFIFAKHYKGYYIIPVLSLISFVYFIQFKIINESTKLRYTGWIMFLFLVFLVFQSVSPFYPFKTSQISLNKENALLSANIRNKISPNDYILIEPTWKSSPMIESSIVFGISYVAGKQLYIKELESNYPNVLTWEGNDNPLRYMRMFDTDMECILKSGRSIFIYSSNNRNAKTICNDLQLRAENLKLALTTDTVYADKKRNEYLIKLTTDQNWRMSSAFHFGFEKVLGGRLYSDDGITQMQGDYKLVHKEKYSGNSALQLDKDLRITPSFNIPEACENDIIEINVKCKTEDTQDAGSFEIVLQIQNDTSLLKCERYFTSSQNEWISYKHKVKIDKPILNTGVHCYVQYKGNDSAYFDDISVRHLTSSGNKNRTATSTDL